MRPSLRLAWRQRCEHSVLRASARFARRRAVRGARSDLGFGTFKIGVHPACRGQQAYCHVPGTWRANQCRTRGEHDVLLPREGAVARPVGREWLAPARDTDGGPHRVWFPARYCFHDSL